MDPLSPALLESMRRVGALLLSGDLRAAHDQLAELVAQHPETVEPLRLLAGTKQALGDIDTAETLLRQALAMDPHWAPTLATLGELLLSRGRGDEAEPLLRRAAQRMPHAAVALARYYNDAQRASEALAVITLFFKDERTEVELVMQHVTALAALGRHDEAIAFYRQRSERFPNDAAATHALAIALDAANRHAEAERVTHSALARGHQTAAAYFTHARSLIGLGEFDRAEAALRDCLQRNPRLVEAQNHLARLVWMRTGDTAQTTAVLDRALQAFADDDALRATKAAILQGAGDARGAYACLADQAANKNAAPALLVRAGLAAMEFDPAASLALAERALRASPANEAAKNLRVASLLGVGDARVALAQAEELLSHTPDDQYLIALQTTAWRLLDDPRYGELCDYAQLVVPQPLQAPAPWADMASFLTDVKRSLERLHPANGHPLLFQSLRHGTETTDDLARSSDPTIQALFAAFDAPIRQYLVHIGQGHDPMRRRNRGSYRFNGGWSVRLRASGFHNNHVHPRGWISSACYIDLPDGIATASTPEGCLVFGAPGIATTPPLAAEHVLRPEVGMLVLFPSYLWHGTVPFTGDRTRLTVAFDVLPDAGEKGA
ncbi:putative 2OG-Fe(II) oxygenase [Rhodanobacter sp. BL-MT-08]